MFKDVGSDNVLVSNKISSGERNNKYVIGYLHDDYKIKSLDLMLSKMSVYVKSYDDQTKWMYFLAKDDDLLTNIMLFRMKSTLILKINLVANMARIKYF